MKHIKKQKAAMDSARIRSLRKKFMGIFMLSFLGVMMFTSSLVNIAFNRASREQMDKVLDILIENEGELVIDEDEDNFASRNSTLLDQFNYGMRYFTVIFKEDLKTGEVTVDLEHVKLMDEETALQCAQDAVNSYFDSGYVNDYYYRIADLEDGRTIVAFVNGSIQTQIGERVLLYTALICAAGLFLTAFIAWEVSKRAIRTELEAYNRQKSFITNASHELKTPLAVIRANTEILELTTGENEWTESTLRQVEHMNGLIQNLVMITRAAEKEDRSVEEHLNLSEVVRSVVEPFTAVAMKDKKKLDMNLEEGLEIAAEESEIRQLISILTDNAIKYCDPEGMIEVSLANGKRGKTVVLTVANDYKDGANVDCSRFFERFYREDAAHKNQQGYGIGLSMAESICKSYGGKISAQWAEGVISFTCVLRK